LILYSYFSLKETINKPSIRIKQETRTSSDNKQNPTV